MEIFGGGALILPFFSSPVVDHGTVRYEREGGRHKDREREGVPLLKRWPGVRKARERPRPRSASSMAGSPLPYFYFFFVSILGTLHYAGLLADLLAYLASS